MFDVNRWAAYASVCGRSARMTRTGAPGPPPPTAPRRGGAARGVDEAANGHGRDRVLRPLETHDVLVKADAGRRQKNHRLPGPAMAAFSWWTRTGSTATGVPDEPHPVFT